MVICGEKTARLPAYTDFVIVNLGLPASNENYIENFDIMIILLMFLSDIFIILITYLCYFWSTQAKFSKIRKMDFKLLTRDRNGPNFSGSS
jgi:hypothetical protein